MKTKLIKGAALPLLAVALAGCEAQPQQPVINTGDKDPRSGYTAEKINGFNANVARYDIDERTGLCYAVNATFHHETISHTWVPATPRVLNLVPQEKLQRMWKAGVVPVADLSAYQARLDSLYTNAPPALAPPAPALR